MRERNEAGITSSFQAPAIDQMEMSFIGERTQEKNQVWESNSQEVEFQLPLRHPRRNT